jgi:hypothetical protein
MQAKYGRMIMCHMLADTVDELHLMADTIGVDRKWFQGDHYDVALVSRAKAVKNGAVEITMRQAVAVRRNFRLTVDFNSNTK